MPGAALRPALLEGLLLIGGGIKWAFQHRHHDHAAPPTPTAMQYARPAATPMREGPSQASASSDRPPYYEQQQQPGPASQHMMHDGGGGSFIPGAQQEYRSHPGPHQADQRWHAPASNAPAFSHSFEDMDWPAAAQRRGDASDSLDAWQHGPGDGAAASRMQQQQEHSEWGYERHPRSAASAEGSRLDARYPRTDPGQPSQVAGSSHPDQQQQRQPHWHDGRHEAQPVPPPQQQYWDQLPAAIPVGPEQQPAWAQPLFTVAPWMRSWGGFL